MFVAPNQRSPDRLEIDFAGQQFSNAYEPQYFDNGSHSEAEVRKRFSSLLNLARENQILNDLGSCRTTRNANWVQNNFELEDTASREDMKDNNSIYKSMNAYSDLVYDKCQVENTQNSGEPDGRYGFLSGVETSRLHQNPFKNNSGENQVCRDFDRDDSSSDRWQTKEGLNRWSPPRDTNHRFRDADAWVTFQNA